MTTLTETFSFVLLASRDAAILALFIGGVLLLVGERLPAMWRHLLWLLVAVRLLMPVLPASYVSWQVWLPFEKVMSAESESVSVPAVTQTKDPEVLRAIGTENTSPASLSEGNNEEALTLHPISHIDRSPVNGAAAIKIPSTNWTVSNFTVCAIIWMTGLSSYLGMILWGTVRFRRKLLRCQVNDHPRMVDLQHMVEATANEAGLSRPPSLQITTAVESPALTGLFRSRILLPESALNRLNDEQLCYVIQHELGHHNRRDVIVQWLLCLLQAVHWFNPIIWWAFYRTRIAAERATDEWVLRRTKTGHHNGYGETLLRLLDDAPLRASSLPGLVGVLENKRDLRTRIRAIGRFTGKRSLWATLSAGVLLLGIAAIGLTQAPDEKKERDQKDLPAGVPLPENIVTPVEKIAKVKITVTGVGGKKIEGADVIVTAGNDPLLKIQAPLLLRGKTNVDGVFVGESRPFRNDASFGHLAVIVISDQGAGYSLVQPGPNQMKEFPWNWDSIERRIIVSSAGDIPIRIVKPDGTPAAGVRIWVDGIARKSNLKNGIKTFLWSLSPPKLSGSVWQAVTDENGECAISGIPLNSQVHFQHDQENWAAFPGYNNIFINAIKPSGERTVLKLLPASLISGRIVSPSGKGVPDVVIDMIEQDPYVTAHHAWAISDHEGKYRINSLPEGKYKLSARTRNFLQEHLWIVKGGQTHIEVEEGQNKNGLDFEVVRGGKIIARFINAETGELIREHIMGVKNEGRVELYHSGLPPEGFHRNLEPFKVDVKTGKTSYVDLPFVPIKHTDQISGIVVDESGLPVADAQVKLLDPENISPNLAFKRCDKNGKFAFDLPSGTEKVKLLAWKKSSASDHSEIFKTGKVVTVKLQANAFGSASGRVIDSEGNPLEGAIVTYTSEWLTTIGANEVITDKNGDFRAENVVPEAHVNFWANKDGYGQNIVQEDVEAGKNVEVGDISLPFARGKVAGRVIDSTGKPVSRAWVTISGNLQADITTNTSRDGRFELGGVVAGWLWVEAGVNSVDGKLFVGKTRIRSGSENVEIQLGAKPDKWTPENVVDFTGKAAPPLRVRKWYNGEGFSPLVNGKIRVVRFVGIDRSLRYFSNSLKSLEQLRKQYEGVSDLEIVAVHGSWPDQEVEELLASKYPDFEIPLSIESDADPMSAAFGVKAWLSVVIDRDGKVALQTKKWSEVKAKVDELMGKKNAGGSKRQSSKPEAKGARASTPTEKPKPVENFDSLKFLVVDSGGQAVPQADIFVFRPSGKVNSFELVQTLLTDGDGKSVLPFGKDDDGVQFIAFSKDRGSGGAQFWPNKRRNNLPELITILIKPTADLSLRVIDQQGNAISGLKFHVAGIMGEPNFKHLLSEIPSGIWNAVTDGEGRCTIKNVPADCRIYVNHDDPRLAQVVGVSNPMKFWHVLEKGEAVIRLQKGKTVAGKVTFPDGQPAGGAEVMIWEKKSGHKQRDNICRGNAFTDEHGRFSVFCLRTGTYDVVVNVPPSEKEDWADLKLAEFKIDGNAPSIELNFTLRKGAVISGRVTSEVEGIKLGGILVRLHPQNGVIKTQARATETDLEGKFSIRAAEGFHNVSIEQPGTEFASLQENGILVEVEEGGKGIANFHFLDPKKDPQVVSGQVIDENGKPVFAELLAAASKGNQGADYWRLDGMHTDAKGRFSVRVPKDVQHPFLYARGNIGTFENPDWLSGEKVFSPMTRVEVGKEVVLQLLPGKRLGTIRGRLVGAGSEALVGIMVGLDFADYGTDFHTGVILTDKNGEFEISHLLPDVRYGISGFNGSENISLVPKGNNKATVIRPKPGETLDLGDMVLMAQKTEGGQQADPFADPPTRTLKQQPSEKKEAVVSKN